MSGKAFVTGFIFFMLAFFLVAMLFNYYPPAANSPLTLVGIAIYALIAVLVTRRMARK